MFSSYFKRLLFYLLLWKYCYVKLISGILFLETPKFGNLMKNITVTVGRDAVLTCMVENLSTFKVAWLRVDTQTILTIQSHVITKNDRIAVSQSDQQVWRLHVKDAAISDRGWYMCQINTDPMKSQTAYIEVVAPPDILDQPTSSDMVVREGGNVTLQCAATGSPLPTVTWRKEDGSEIILDQEPRRASFVKNSLLTLIKVNWRHSGIYLCIASNGVPPTVSKRISLIVHYAPKVHIRNQLVSANLGHSIILECETEAYPKPIYYWTFDNGQLITDGEVYETFLLNYMYKVRMQLQIREVTPSSYRDYICVSKNPLGTSEGTVRVYPLEAEWRWHTTSKPLGYLNNSVQENSSTCARLACMSLSLCITLHWMARLKE